MLRARASRWVAATLVLAACESADLVSPDAGPDLPDAAEDRDDGPPPEDAGDADDAGDAGDAGDPGDTGPPMDAEPPPDLGPDLDAGPPLDSGPPDDAGVLDSGTTCDPGSTLVPEVPALLSPANGATMGSARAPSTLRPRLRWRAAERACRYEVQLDRACDPFDFRTCDHGGDTPSFATPDLEHRTRDPLDVDLTAPVGARYYWRVRACNAIGCSAYGETRYLDLGRLPDDFDGDGDSELVVGCPECPTAAGSMGVVFVYDGGDPLGPDPIAVEHPATPSYARFGGAVATGDIDGDGFGDLVVGAHTETSAAGDDTGAVYVLRGGPTGLHFAPADMLPLPSGIASAFGYYGEAVAVAGDVDADGDRDVIIGASGERAPTGVVHLARGRSVGMAADPPVALVTGPIAGGVGVSVAGVGDIDGDGIVDFAAGANRTATDGLPFSGAVFVWRGTTGATLASPMPIVGTAPAEGDLFGTALAGADFDDDGLSDVLIGADRRELGNGFVELAYGAFDARLVASARGADAMLVRGAMLGWAASTVGDVEGDGVPDVYVTAPTLYAGDSAGGVYRIVRTGDPDVLLCERTSFDPGTDVAIHFGYDVGGGDFDGDGYADLAVGAPGPIGEGRMVRERAWIFYGGRTALSAPVEVVPPYAPMDATVTRGFGRAID